VAQQQMAPKLISFVADPYRDWAARYPGRRAFGYFCTYAPLEILHAAGFVPVRLMQLSGTVALADAHLPSFACALVRTVTERLLSGELDFLAGVLFVHTCDTMQCAADIWRLAGRKLQVVNLSLPTVLSGSSARGYLLSELRGLAATLESQWGAVVDEARLRASIALYNEQRRLLSSLDAQRGHFDVQQLWALTLASMVMPVEEHLALLRSVLQSVEGQEALPEKGPRVILVGAILDEVVIPQLIHDVGGVVAGDDLCTGSRYFDTLAAEDDEPFAALADRYLRRAPCAAKHDAARSRAERLLEMVGNKHAQGVIFVLPKFCDPHAFDYVLLSKALDAAQVPHLLVETDITAPGEQLRTRVQAFLEILHPL